MGQPALKTMLSFNIHAPLRQRISLVHTMQGLIKNETEQYLESRFKIAGCNESQPCRRCGNSFLKSWLATNNQ
jgi:type II secretory pathway predicted ATPase ExeA